MTAGITIIGGIVLGAAVGYGIGALIGAATILGLAGAAAGLVLGFYGVWTRFFKTTR